MIVSHDPESARVADRIVRIRDGRVSEEWSRDDDDERHDRRRPRRLAAAARGAAAARRHRDEGRARFEDGAVVVAPAGDPQPGVAAGARASPRLPAPPGPVVVVRPSALAKSYGTTTGPRRPRPRVRRRAAARGHRPVRLGQDDAAAPARRASSFPTAATITVDGVDLTGLDRTGARSASPRARSRYVGQQAGLVPHLSALENVELALALRGRERRRPPGALAALDSVGLGERATQRVSRLSQGERARVAIARAIAPGRALLLADEPTSRLDGANAIAVAILLARLARDTGAAVVCATHDPLVIEQADSQISLS